MATLKINDGGPAFPCESYGLKNGKETTVPAQGMTLRDYFVGQALANKYTYEADPASVAKWSYKIADEMIKAREVEYEQRKTED